MNLLSHVKPKIGIVLGLMIHASVAVVNIAMSIWNFTDIKKEWILDPWSPILLTFILKKLTDKRGTVISSTWKLDVLWCVLNMPFLKVQPCQNFCTRTMPNDCNISMQHIITLLQHVACVMATLLWPVVICWSLYIITSREYRWILTCVEFSIGKQYCNTNSTIKANRYPKREA